jgi:hypothetical protein
MEGRLLEGRGRDLCSSAKPAEQCKKKQHCAEVPAKHGPARAAGNMFFLVFFWGIFICFCFWWNMKHHVRVQ